PRVTGSAPQHTPALAISRKGDPSGRGGSLFVGAPRALHTATESLHNASDFNIGTAQLFRRFSSECFLEDDLASHAVRPQRVLDGHAKQPAFARVCADVRVADAFRVDDAADDERSAST